MSVLVMVGENEFAFSIKKAEKQARATITTITFLQIHNASHLLPVSKPDYINHTIIDFLTKE